MKTSNLHSLFIALFLACYRLPAPAAAFSSGSTGADGPLSVTSYTTLQVPPDGVFNFTTIDISYNTTLRFIPNELNTPVYLLATGDVMICGTIDVSGLSGGVSAGGLGGPGGFDGGSAANGGLTPGDGYGPGGGTGGSDDPADPNRARGGTHAVTTANSVSNRYGNALLQPIVGGSGGGGSNSGGGGGGGGAIEVISSTLIDIGRYSNLHSDCLGQIRADGGYGRLGYLHSGSGGAIRLVAPKIKGSGYLSAASEGQPTGRIRVDTTDRSQMDLNMFGRVSIGANMVVFSSPTSRLDIVEVAGRPVPFGTNGSVRIQLPLNASTNQTVKVMATDFSGLVSLEVVVAPENGATVRFPATVDLTRTNQATVNVNVIIPPDIPCRIQAWTR